MGKSKVMIVGSINQDIIFSNPIKTTEVGMMFADYTLANGGKGANQAATASKLGAESAIVGRVGNDLYGNSQLNGLKALGVNTDYVVVDENNKTGVAYLSIKKDGTYYCDTVIGANSVLNGEDVKTALQEFQPELVIMQIEMPFQTVYDTYQYASELNIPVILDPGPAQQIDLAPLKGIFMISPNEDETYALTGIHPIDEKSISEAAARLYEETNSKYIVLKLGAKGAYLLEDGKEPGMLFPPYPVNAVDSTGAGDTFTAALGIALCEGKEITEAIRFANAAGAICVSRRGGQPSVPTKDEVLQFFAKNR